MIVRWFATIVVLGLALEIFAAAQAGDDGSDVVLLLDNSGSMRINDPQFQTAQAAGELISALSAHDRIAIVVFDEDARLAAPLTAVTPRTSNILHRSLRQLSFRGLYTNSAAGFEQAIRELKGSPRPDARKVIVFVTDGIIDSGSQELDTELSTWMRSDLAAEAREADIRVLGVAFTEAADLRLIQSLASSTAGTVYRALTTEDLRSAFAEITLSLTSDGGEERPPSGTEPLALEAATDSDQARLARQTDSVPPDPGGFAAGQKHASEDPASAAVEPVTSSIPGAESPALAAAPALPKPDDDLVETPGRSTPAVALSELPQSAPAEGGKSFHEITGTNAGAVKAGAAATDPDADQGPDFSKAMNSIEPEWRSWIREKRSYLIGLVLVAAGIFAMALIRRVRRARTALPEIKHRADPDLASPISSTALLTDLNTATEQGCYDLSDKTTCISRTAEDEADVDLTIVIDRETISRRHAMIQLCDSGYWIEDLGSVNGTFVNGEPLTAERQLRNGDRISFHHFDFEFLLGPPSTDSEATTVNPCPAPDDQPTVLIEPGAGERSM